VTEKVAEKAPAKPAEKAPTKSADKTPPKSSSKSTKDEKTEVIVVTAASMKVGA
jgi:hypothetical protein